MNMQDVLRDLLAETERRAAYWTPERLAQQKAEWEHLGGLAERFAVETDPQVANELAMEMARRGGVLGNGGHHHLWATPPEARMHRQSLPDNTPEYSDSPAHGPKFV